jgi:hypothetical protein
MARSVLPFPAVLMSSDTVIVALIFFGFASVANAHCSGSISFAVPNAVPDGGMTAILLGSALAVLALVRRFVKR